MKKIVSFDIETIPKQGKLQQWEEDLTLRLMSKRNKNYQELQPEEFNDLKNLVMATDPRLGEIITIGLYAVQGNSKKEIPLKGDEKQVLTEFWDYLKNVSGTTFVSFNGLDFDVPFILTRSMYHQIPATNNNFMNKKRWSIYPHFDVKLVGSNWDKYSIGTLKQLCLFLNIPSPKEGDIKAQNVAQAFKDGRIDEIADYCVRDVVATYECYERMKSWTFNPFK